VGCHRCARAAAFAVDREGLNKIPKMPIMLVHGDGTVIGSHQAEVFAFFARHSR
jgi:hypothetical protein